MDIERLREFITLGEYLNYSVASRELFIAQSTLSEHIQAVEKELGFDLVKRSGGAIDLTDAGCVFFDRAQQIVSLYDRALSESKAASKPDIVIRVTDLVPAVGLAGAFERAVGSLNSRDPATSCKVTFVNVENQRTEDLLAGGAIDIGLVSSCEGEQPRIGSDEDRLTFFFIRRVPLRLYVGEDSPLARRETLHPADLVGTRVLTSNQPQFRSDRESISTMLERHGITPEYRMYRARSQFDRLPIERDTILFLTPHYAALYQNIWADCGAGLVQCDVEGLELALDYHGVHRIDAPHAVRDIGAEIERAAQNG